MYLRTNFSVFLCTGERDFDTNVFKLLFVVLAFWGVYKFLIFQGFLLVWQNSSDNFKIEMVDLRLISSKEEPLLAILSIFNMSVFIMLPKIIAL